MAAQSEIPDSEATPTKSDELKQTELRWKIRVAKADVLQKILISIIGAFVAGVFYVYQANETNSRYYAELQAERERADADLRANMFRTLFEAYFKNKIDAAQKLAEEGGDTMSLGADGARSLDEEIMLSDLLARNFETVDVRPLFEEMDRRLSTLIRHDSGAPESLIQRKEAFLLRERLRRVSYGAAARQVELLRANAGATAEREWVTQCQSGHSADPVVTPPQLERLPESVLGLVKRVEDGSVSITLVGLSNDEGTAGMEEEEEGVRASSRPRDVPIVATYFDMPLLETVRLSNGDRLAITVRSFVSTETCALLTQDENESKGRDFREACEAVNALSDYPDSECSRAEVSITVIPKGFIGMRDRPYLSELSREANTSIGSIVKRFSRSGESSPVRE